MSKDPNYAVKIEQAIAAKYGEEAIQNPKKNGTRIKKKFIWSRCENSTRNKRKTTKPTTK